MAASDTFDLPEFPRSHAELIIEPIDVGAVVHDARTQKVHVLNTSAAAILQLCDGTRTVPVIVAEVLPKTGASVAQVHDDVSRILGEFRAMRLVDDGF
jgi:hypothetical protein